MCCFPDTPNYTMLTLHSQFENKSSHDSKLEQTVYKHVRSECSPASLNKIFHKPIQRTHVLLTALSLCSRSATNARLIYSTRSRFLRSYQTRSLCSTSDGSTTNFSDFEERLSNKCEDQLLPCPQHILPNKVPPAKAH